jgi:hypothetical protein
MFVRFVRICGTSEDINSMSLHQMWFDFLNVARSQVVGYQVLYVLIKCLMICKHVPVHFYKSQDQSFSNGHILQTWIF